MEAVKNTKSKEMNPAKVVLIELSKAVSGLVENGDFENVNQAVIETFYKSEEHQEFSTFKGWKEKNFMVKKGSKGFAVWSKPLKGKSIKEEGAPVQEVPLTEELGRSFFGVAYLFSNSQVQPLNA